MSILSRSSTLAPTLQATSRLQCFKNTLIKGTLSSSRKLHSLSTLPRSQIKSSTSYRTCNGPANLSSVPKSARQFTTRTPPPAPGDDAAPPPPPEVNAEGQESPKLSEMSPEMWLKALENTASAPWLSTIPEAHEDRLKRAYALLFQVVLYLGRPQEEGMAEQFLIAFETAPAPPESEIGRARVAVATLTRAVVSDMSSIPDGSPLRAQHAEAFGIFGALLAAHDMYLMEADGKVEPWGEFWSRAQPIVLSLGMKLDEDGFGLKPE